MEYPVETFEDSKAIIADTVITGDVGQAGKAADYLLTDPMPNVVGG